MADFRSQWCSIRPLAAHWMEGGVFHPDYPAFHCNHLQLNPGRSLYVEIRFSISMCFHDDGNLFCTIINLRHRDWKPRAGLHDISEASNSEVRRKASEKPQHAFHECRSAEWLFNHKSLGIWVTGVFCTLSCPSRKCFGESASAKLTVPLLKQTTSQNSKAVLVRQAIISKQTIIRTLVVQVISIHYISQVTSVYYPRAVLT